MQSANTFGTAITCMDGRIQDAVNQYLKRRFKVKYIDVITEPGPNRIIAEATNLEIIQSIYDRLAISTNKHLSKHIAIVGHEDCAGNPVGFDEQKDHILKAISMIRSHCPDKTVIGLWVELDGTIREF